MHPWVGPVRTGLARRRPDAGHPRLDLALGASLSLPLVHDLVPSGRFARLGRKALRLYAELGLLPPAHVNPDNGYRYAPGVTRTRPARTSARPSGGWLGPCGRKLRAHL